jgi:zinc transport system substrate-binding protein
LLAVVMSAALVLALSGAVATAAVSRVRVVASFYPLAWATRVVGGAGVRVSDLTPSGAEPHDLELTSGARDAIDDADLAVVLGGGFQPAVEDATGQRAGPTLAVIDSLPKAVRVRARHDPHVWLDPVLMRSIVTAISSRLQRLDPGHRARYRAAAGKLAGRLVDLDAEYRSGLASCARKLLVTAHEAFGWLARRYGLEQRGIAGIDPELEPAPDRLAELADLARREGVTTIFTEELVSSRVARTVAREAGGLRTKVLSPLESLSPTEHDRGDDYFDVMRANLAKLRTALGCT